MVILSVHCNGCGGAAGGYGMSTRNIVAALLFQFLLLLSLLLLQQRSTAVYTTWGVSFDTGMKELEILEVPSCSSQEPQSSMVLNAAAASDTESSDPTSYATSVSAAAAAAVLLPLLLLLRMLMHTKCDQILQVSATCLALSRYPAFCSRSGTPGTATVLLHSLLLPLLLLVLLLLRL